MARIIIVAVSWLLQIINFLILVNVILTWLPIGMDNKFVRIIVMLTEPILAPCRALLNRIPATRNLPLDFSPILAWLILMLIGTLVTNLIYFV